MSNTGNIPGKRKGILFFYALGFLYSLGLVHITYFLQRSDSLPLILTFGGLFALCLLSYRRAEQVGIRHWFMLALLLRLLLLPAVPGLSDDFYRFIWDGRLLLAGEHPFAHLPSWYMQTDAPSITGISPELFRQLNSPGYYTIYPPLHQATFYLAALMGGESLFISQIVLRIPLMLAEAGSLWLILKLLQFYRKPGRNFLLYALNPLVILEGTGNLHFEAVMVFFLLLVIYLLSKYRQQPKNLYLASAAAAFAAAVASKLLPLMFLPLLFRKLGWRPFVIFLFCGWLVSLLLFLPLFNPVLLSGLQNSLSLYYQKFEFNASLYYLFREAGYWLKGYNVIGTAGPLMALLATGSILLFSLSRKAKNCTLPAGMLLVYTLFLLFSLTVHPWYIIPLLALSLFTGYRFPLLWSGLVFLTYAGYSKSGFEESSLVLMVEYGGVGLFFLWEWQRNNWHKSEQKPYSKRLAG